MQGETERDETKAAKDPQRKQQNTGNEATETTATVETTTTKRQEPPEDDNITESYRNLNETEFNVCFIINSIFINSFDKG